MASIGVVKMSTLTAEKGTWLSPATAIRVKERLDARGAEETPDEARAEIATMRAEADQKMQQARTMRDEANAMVETAREMENDAAVLVNEDRSTLTRRMR
jgi:uncharacterized coiled-coil DUF342 family protein